MASHNKRRLFEQDILNTLDDYQKMAEGNDVLWAEESLLAAILLGGSSRKNRRKIRACCKSLLKRGLVLKRQYLDLVSWRVPDENWPLQ